MKNLIKKVLVFLLALLPCLHSHMMANCAKNEEPYQIPIRQDPNPNPKPNPGPRMRSSGRSVEASTLVCNYYEGEVSIQAGTDITFINATVTRLDNNEQFTNVGFGYVTIIQVSEDSGTYALHITLSDGTGYYGEYSLF